jgi:hypothetical protein
LQDIFFDVVVNCAQNVLNSINGRGNYPRNNLQKLRDYLELTDVTDEAIENEIE